ncbi:MAG: long-chain fatty acid--CoA ligase [Defluviicoccus sp.]
MRGMMMDAPLLIPTILEYAAKFHGGTEVVSRTEDGGLHRSTYAEIAKRARKLANALSALGLRPGDRVGTLAWNDHRHFELYYAVPGTGLICHTVNPRLFPDQIQFIIDDAEDRYVFVDPSFVTLLAGIAARLPKVRGFVVMTDRAHMPAIPLPNVLCYEELIANQPDTFDWPVLDENTASGLCYTSGTTGNPKGVLYSHRSTLLHAMAANRADVLGFSVRDVVMPVVPMFHVNSWGVPYCVAMTGAKVVFPGGKLDGASLLELINGEGVTFTAGVPTVWLALLDHVDVAKASLAPLDRVMVGGSACPASMIERFAARGVRVIHAWGMTETSPIAATSVLAPQHDRLSAAEQMALRIKQGRPPYGADMRIVDADGAVQPWDGKTSGTLEVRGAWICAGYFNNADRFNFSADGWFATGDVCTITADGFMEIVDRTKDMIKSGGEWISSIALENIAIAHPAVREVAAIARADEKWGERPRLVIALKKGAELTAEEMRRYLEPQLAKWCIPDDIVIVNDLPHTATGKLLKMELRRLYGSESVPGALKL